MCEVTHTTPGVRAVRWTPGPRPGALAVFKPRGRSKAEANLPGANPSGANLSGVLALARDTFSSRAISLRAISLFDLPRTQCSCLTRTMAAARPDHGSTLELRFGDQPGVA
jgi:hypothetical protein